LDDELPTWIDIPPIATYLDWGESFHKITTMFKPILNDQPAGLIDVAPLVVLEHASEAIEKIPLRFKLWRDYDLPGPIHKTPLLAPMELEQRAGTFFLIRVDKNGVRKRRRQNGQ